VTSYGTDVDLYPDRFTGFPYEPLLQLEVRGCSSRGGMAPACALFPVFRMHDIEVGKPGQFVGLVFEHLTERRVHLAQAPIKISSHHSERVLFKYPPEPLLALAQRPFNAFPIRDVPQVDTC
jgi:hypothetical protein